MNFIEQCIVEKECHEQEILNRLKRLNEIKLQIQECKVQEVKESDASSGNTNSSGIVLDKDMCNNEFKDDENDDHEDERVMLANLIANLNLDIDENKKIQKQLRNTNTTLTHELKVCLLFLRRIIELNSR
nr:hypothetical protein [Tanacetum cinerariifolium]